MLRAVIFDLDDTLYDYTSLHVGAVKALGAYVYAHYGITEEKFHALFTIAKKETKCILGKTAASHNRLLYCQKILEHLNVSPVENALEMYEVYWGYILEHIVPREGAIDLLTTCKENSIKIGICSDLTAYIQHRKLKSLGIASLIDCLVTSEEVGAEKPDSRMFTTILKKLKCKPQEALFIGDSLECDIRGAERVGIPALWLGGNDENNTITSLKEVRILLNGRKSH